MKMLRDLRLSTKMLIIFELINDPKTTLKPLAAKLEMTVQGVSEYFKRMEEEGLIERHPGEYKPTKKGVQFLHDNIIALKEFADSAIKRLQIIRICAAVARTPVREGERVGLFMENGVLVAYANRTSASTGTALLTVHAGDDVPVKDLDGIVTLSMGRLVIVELPPIEHRGTHSVSVAWAKNVISKLKYDKVAALDTVGAVFARKLGLTVDFEFAASQAGIEAAQKGLSVLFIGSADEVHRLVSRIEEINAGATEAIVYELVLLK